MISLHRKLKNSARKSYDYSLSLIPTKIQDYDSIKKIGKLWIKRGYFRSYTIDTSTPYWLKLYTGPQEEYLCPIINPFLEELEDLGYILGDAKIEETIVTVAVKEDNNEYSISKGTIRFIPTKPDRCIRIEEIEKMETTKVLKSSMIC